MTETFDASLISAITHVIAQACTLGFSLIRQSSAVPIVCFRAIDQASSDAFNGQNRTISFDRVPFTLAYRTSPDFAFNLSAAGLHIKMIDRTYPIPYAGYSGQKAFAAESQFRYGCLSRLAHKSLSFTAGDEYTLL
jgi:hypothetical protein